jgi:hypothetical protein
MNVYEDSDVEDPRYGDGCLGMIVAFLCAICFIAGLIFWIFN